MTEQIEENIDKIEKELDIEFDNYFKANAIVLSTLVVGAGMYILGRSKGKGLGHAKGRAEGYVQGIKDIGGMFREIRNQTDK